jgi:RimJ/RimL family protein N-acetyltransferase
MNKANIRLLQPDDWLAWKSLRLEGLQNAPEAFGSSYEEEVDYSEEYLKSYLKRSTIFGAFIGSDLIGCVGFFTLEQIKMRHRGVLYSMYVRPEHRGHGIANRLVEGVIAHAKSQVIQLHLTCVTSNSKAIRLYEKHGFRIYGTEPRALKVGDVFYDEHLMALKFD